jgi:hypothetical protein
MCSIATIGRDRPAHGRSTRASLHSSSSGSGVAGGFDDLELLRALETFSREQRDVIPLH